MLGQSTQVVFSVQAEYSRICVCFQSYITITLLKDSIGPKITNLEASQQNKIKLSNCCLEARIAQGEDHFLKKPTIILCW